MMPDLPFVWHLAVLALCLGGLALLALASDREGQVLLRRSVTAAQKRLLRWLGWPLLALAMALCAWGWFAHFGTVLWFGWLTVAAVALVIAIAYWPWRRQAAAHRRTTAKTNETAPPPPARTLPAWVMKSTLALALVGIPLAFGWALHGAPAHPLSRPDAIEAQLGPWRLRLAEDRRGPPTITPQGIPIKTWHLRWCEGCGLDIHAAYLKVHKPRTPRNPGSVFEGPHWDRVASIQLPANTTADSELWLTVVGRNGTVHQASWLMKDASPDTVAWFEQRRHMAAQ